MAKKILFIITKSEMGGAQRFLYEFITHLNPYKYEFLVAAGPPAGGELLEKLGKKGVKIASLKSFSNTPGLKNFLAFFETFNLIRKFKPDILYLLSSEAGFIGAIAGKFYRLLFWRKNPKIIYRIGGWAFKEPRNIFIKKIYLWAEKLSAPFKDIIITNSEFDRHLAIKNKIAKPDKIITIYNGLDVDNLKFLPKEEAKIFIESKIVSLREISRSEKNSVLVGTIANLYRNKGLEYLILAAQKLKNKGLDWQFVIIGEGPE
ncbi:MAG: glycosyltransferase, partial [Candidatus Azambacteria bacterium]|nr:glycosyltransferase [Candidatus Azambacteria bacterium]